PAPASMEAAAAQAAHDALVALFPSVAQTFPDLLAARLAASPAGPARDAGVAVGAQVAAEILSWRDGDGSSGSVPYTPSLEPGSWRPTLPFHMRALYPHWGTVTPFAMGSGDQFRPGVCPGLTTAEYAAACNEVKE